MTNREFRAIMLGTIPDDEEPFDPDVFMHAVADLVAERAEDAGVRLEDIDLGIDEAGDPRIEAMGSMGARLLLDLAKGHQNQS